MFGKNDQSMIEECFSFELVRHVDTCPQILCWRKGVN